MDLRRVRRRVPPGLLAVLLLLLFAVQAFPAAKWDSVTIDEFAHLPTGLYVLRTWDFGTDPMNPPLSRLISALPLCFSPPAFSPEPGMPYWALGELFMHQNAGRYQSIFIRARTITILEALLLGWLVFSWASRLYGRPAGVIALFLFCFSPCMLAHGHLAALDMPGALGFTAALYSVWKLLERPTAARARMTGAVAAVATLLKLTGVVLIATVPLLLAVSAAREAKEAARTPPGRRLVLLGIAGLTFLFVINLGYGFQGTLTRLDHLDLDPGGALSRLKAAVPWLRLPLPLPLIAGVDQIMRIGKDRLPEFFLDGTLSSTGWWYYHLAAFALKTPIPMVVASLLAVGLWCAGRSRGTRDYCLYVPVMVVFAFNSLFNSLDIGVRHVLAVYPLLFIAVSPHVARPLHAIASGSRRPAEFLKALAVTLGLVWFGSAAPSVAPRYLEYFNEIAGGPANGHRMLIDSNLDWGQDLIRLRRYMKERAIPSVNLAYFGRVDPQVYGILYEPLRRGRSHGPTAVSASFLMGRPYYWYLDGEMEWVPPGTYTWLQKLTPAARVGSMFVYDLP